MRKYDYLTEMKTNPKFILHSLGEGGQTQFLSAVALAKADFVSNFEYTKIINA